MIRWLRGLAAAMRELADSIGYLAIAVDDTSVIIESARQRLRPEEAPERVTPPGPA